MEKSLEERVKILEDIEAIRQLKYFYCYCVDRAIGGDPSGWDEIFERYTSDIRGDYDQMGIHEGKTAVMKFFRENVPAVFSFTRHMPQNPKIVVSGNTAKGTWYVFVPCTTKGNEAGWIEAKYDDVYERVDGRWMFKEIKAVFDFFTPYCEGWAKTRFFQ